MKLMIASDIHGSAFYCDKMLNTFAKENPERLLLLGDLLYHGPRNDLPKNYEPKKVIRMLNGIKDKIICVRGNCEAEVDQMVLEFPVLSESLLMFLDNRLIFATHGHIYNKDKLPALQPGDVFLQGHTHIPVLGKIGDNFFMNPGSVSIPKENSEHSYMIYENQSFTLKNLDGKILSDFNLLS
ncbi:MAG: phosphodiesterase [Spirochaetales bacterium]|nr:phosphodiesterase [Spirochaetales bacterium]